MVSLRLALVFAALALVSGFGVGVGAPRSLARISHRVQQQPVAVVVDISSTEELNEALENAGDSLVVVDYSTSWCGPCKIIAPKFDEFSEQYKNVNFLKVHARPNAEEQLPKCIGLQSFSSCDSRARVCVPSCRSWATAAPPPTN